MTTFSDLRKRAIDILHSNVHDPVDTAHLLYDLIARLDDQDTKAREDSRIAQERYLGLRR